jgi:hypothetical protein
MAEMYGQTACQTARGCNRNESAGVELPRESKTAYKLMIPHWLERNSTIGSGVAGAPRLIRLLERMVQNVVNSAEGVPNAEPAEAFPVS